MSTDVLSSELTQRLLASLTLPPMPTVLSDVRTALARDADAQVLADIVGQDIALSAAVIKVANSPAFSAKRLDSIHEAVLVLGATNLESIVAGISLRNAIPLPPILHTFWDEASRRAGIAAAITRRWHLGRPEQTYLFSLFRDAGIPVLVQRFDFYLTTLRNAMADPANFVAHEDASRATSHTTVGCLLARTWGMPEAFSEAILAHHNLLDLHDRSRISFEAARLIAVGRLAEHLLVSGVMGEIDGHWGKIERVVLDELGISRDDVEEFRHTLA